MRGLMCLTALLFCVGEIAAAEEISEEQQAEALSLLEEMAEELGPVDSNSLTDEQRDSLRQLQEADVALLEAHAWLKRELPAEAGLAFMRSGKAFASIPDEHRAVLQPRLADVERRRLSLARLFLENDYLLPVEEQADQDVEAAADPDKAASEEQVEAPEESTSSDATSSPDHDSGKK